MILRDRDIRPKAQRTNPPSPALAEQRGQLRRNDTARSIVMLLMWPFIGVFGTLLVAILAGLAQDLIPGAPAYTREIVIVVAGVMLLNAWVLLITRKALYKPTGRFVLWLRRFHEDGAFPFNVLLEDASRGIALPVTVQDTTVARSGTAASVRSVLFATQALVGASFLGGFVLLAYGMDPAKVLATVAPLLLGGYALLIWLQARGGNNDLRTARGQKRLRKLLRLMDTGERIPQALTIVRMSDEHWKDWVGEFIRRADAVIVDVTHLTDSLAWELQTCARHLHPEQLILACGHYEDSKIDPWADVNATLAKLLDGDFVRRSQQFTYQRPRRKAFWAGKFRGWEQREARRLRSRYEQAFLDKLEVAFAHAPTHDAAIPAPGASQPG